MIDMSLIIETWEAVKPCVNPKDKSDACASLVRVFDENGLLDYDKVGINDCDGALKQAIEEYYEIEESDEDDDEGWD